MESIGFIERGPIRNSAWTLVQERKMRKKCGLELENPWHVPLVLGKWRLIYTVEESLFIAFEERGTTEEDVIRCISQVLFERVEAKLMQMYGGMNGDDGEDVESVERFRFV